MSKCYLCIDLKDEKGNIKTCYLLHDDVEKIARFTSYCTCLDMFLNTLAKNNSTNVKQKVNFNYKDTRLYYKKTKDGQKIDVIYSKDKDTFYAETSDILNLFRRMNTMCYNGHFPSDDVTIEVYKLLSSMVSSDAVKRRIIENFNEEYDSDKNTEYYNYRNFELYQKIALSNKNVYEVLNYIFSDPLKKIVFLGQLKRLVGKNLIDDGKLIENERKMDYKISRNGYNPQKMIVIINNNILSFLNKRNKLEDDEDYMVQDGKITISDDDDDIYRYRKMIEDPDVDPDIKDSLIAYIDAQKYELKKRRKNI